MLSENNIEPAQTEWATYIVFVSKKNGALQFCVDFRKPSAVAERDLYPTPRMDECIDSPGEANVFSTFDASSGNW